MKNLALSALGRKARDSFCRCGSGASSGASSNCSSRDEGVSCCRSFDLAAAKQASVNKLARLLGEEVKSDDKVLFDHCVVSRGRRNAIPNIFCGLPSKGLRRLFAVYGIDEVQTKAPCQPVDLDEEARRERRQLRESRCGDGPQAGSSHQQHWHQHKHQHQHQHRARSAMDPCRRRLQLPAFVAVDQRRAGELAPSPRHSHVY